MWPGDAQPAPGSRRSPVDRRPGCGYRRLVVRATGCSTRTRWPGTCGRPISSCVEPAGWKVIAAELTSLERSFWGLFGWLNALPDLVYQFFRAGVALGGRMAVGAGALGCARPAHPCVGMSVLVRAGRAGCSCCSGWRSSPSRGCASCTSPAAQGRYFFPRAGAGYAHRRRAARLGRLDAGPAGRRPALPAQRTYAVVDHPACLPTAAPACPRADALTPVSAHWEAFRHHRRERDTGRASAGRTGDGARFGRAPTSRRRSTTRCSSTLSTPTG